MIMPDPTSGVCAVSQRVPVQVWNALMDDQQCLNKSIKLKEFVMKAVLSKCQKCMLLPVEIGASAPAAPANSFTSFLVRVTHA